MDLGSGAFAEVGSGWMSEASGLRAIVERARAQPSSLRRRTPANVGLFGLLALLGVTLIVFAFFPGIDLAVSRFFAPDGHFSPEATFGRAGRDFFRVAPYLLLIALTLAYVLRRFGIAGPF